MTDPLIQAARELLDGSLDALRGAIEGADAPTLDRRPGGEGTNSIAVLVVHAMNSTRWWLSVATGAQVPERDRPSEFLATAGSPKALLRLLDGIAADCRGLLDAHDSFDAGASRTAPATSRAMASGAPETVTAAWALLHALEHLREHVAHAQLTRQLADQRDA